MVIEELLKRNHKVDIVVGSYNLPEYQELVQLKVDNLLYNDKGYNMSTSVSIIAVSLACYLSTREELYDIAVVHGDRYENLGFAIACSYSGIMLLHTEGGENSGQIDDKVRNAISALSDVHCAASQLAFEAINSSLKFFTGSPAIDYVKSLNLFSKKPTKDFILALYNPTDNEDPEEFSNAIEAISKMEQVVWVNPNFDPGHRITSKVLHKLDSVKFVKGLTPPEYYKLLYNCRLLIGNTSSGIKEGAFLEIPYLLVGDRQKGREIGFNVFKVNNERKEIIKFATTLLNADPYAVYTDVFGKGDASKKIADIIERVSRV
jgi:UDP-hydrolysing UDP-N-acetyl-D-glucosamine 2-epimerase